LGFVARSRPRSAEERRRDIIAATVPLLEEEGFAVSTRRIADAAGVAEGTLFRVFATKQELIRAAIASSTDPADLIELLDAIESSLPLDQKMSEVMSIVEESASRVRTFMISMKGRSLAAAATWRAQATADLREGRVEPQTCVPPDLTDLGDPRPPHQVFAFQIRQLKGAVERVLAPNRSELSVDLGTAATFILTIGLASLMMRSALPAMGADTTVALALRALTGGDPTYRKDAE